MNTDDSDPKADRKILFIGNENSVFVYRSKEALQNRGIEVDIYDPQRSSLGKSGGRLARIAGRVLGMLKAARKMPKYQSVIIHYLSLDTFWMALIFKRKTSRLIGLAYGSDILRRNKRYDPLLQLAMREMSCIAATNLNVMQSINKDFPLTTKKENKIIRFGLPVYDEIDHLCKKGRASSREAREALGLDPDKPVICLGYSASAGQRQKELIYLFSKCEDTLQRYQFLIPVQYGEASVISEICALCDEIHRSAGIDNFFPLTEFHDERKAAIMRIATSVLINNSVSDAFSGTVQEVVYAGNLVFSSDQLPYSGMPGFGSAIYSYSSPEELVHLLEPQQYERLKEAARKDFESNKIKLRATSSWDGVFDDWREMLG